MTTIKAIETRYKGYRFRSRLEARWAVFFDALGLKWEYEKQGYALPSGTYLPDFWLPQLKCWVEIKGQKPSELERALARELSQHTQANVFIFPGDLPGYDVTWDGFWSTETVDAYLAGGGWDNFHAFCVCDSCGAIGIQFEGRSDRLPCKSHGCKVSAHGDKWNTFDHPKILNAIQAARSARFEHGEAPG